MFPLGELPGPIPIELVLNVPQGAVSQPTQFHLTALSAQGLPALLPLGWSPIAAFDAEGAGHWSRKDKRRMYAIARGSATETAAIVDVLRLRRLAPEGACASARILPLRVVQLPTKLDAAPA